MSTGAEPLKMPVRPPKINTPSAPRANSMGDFKLMFEPHRVAMIENITTAKGTEIMIVVMLKGMAKRGSMPLIY